MNEECREKIFAAQAAWKAARQTLDDELGRYISVGRLSDGPMKLPEKVFDHAAAKLIDELREAVREAEDVYVRTIAECAPS